MGSSAPGISSAVEAASEKELIDMWNGMTDTARNKFMKANSLTASAQAAEAWAGFDEDVWLASERCNPVAKKSGGSAIGAIYDCDGHKWLGKAAMCGLQVTPTESCHEHSKCRIGGNLDAIKEKVAADAYQFLARSCFDTPRVKLAMLRLINDFTKTRLDAQEWLRILNDGRVGEPIEDTVFVMSEMVENFKPLSAVSIKTDGGVMSFKEFVKKYLRPPEDILHEDKQVPLDGIMEVLATSRLLGDTDVLGGGFLNAGFTVKDGRAKVVKIDPGYSFNFKGSENKLFQCSNTAQKPPERLEDEKDLQYGNLSPDTIKWKELTCSQRSVFLDFLQKGLLVLNEQAREALCFRAGAFNRLHEDRGLALPDIRKRLNDWEENLQKQKSIYL